MVACTIVSIKGMTRFGIDDDLCGCIGGMQCLTHLLDALQRDTLILATIQT